MNTAQATRQTTHPVMLLIFLNCIVLVFFRLANIAFISENRDGGGIFRRSLEEGVGS
jgi:hypothetical protein